MTVLAWFCLGFRRHRLYFFFLIFFDFYLASASRSLDKGSSSSSSSSSTSFLAFSSDLTSDSGDDVSWAFL